MTVLPALFWIKAGFECVEYSEDGVLLLKGRVSDESMPLWQNACYELLSAASAEGFRFDISKVLELYPDGEVRYMWRFMALPTAYGLPIEELYVLLSEIDPPPKDVPEPPAPAYVPAVPQQARHTPQPQQFAPSAVDARIPLPADGLVPIGDRPALTAQGLPIGFAAFLPKQLPRSVSAKNMQGSMQ